MANTVQVSRRKRVPKWKILMSLQRDSIEEIFPPETYYRTSRWAKWEKRINDAHALEEKRIEQELRKLVDAGPIADNYGFDPQRVCGQRVL